jgi:hypothetical protein
MDAKQAFQHLQTTTIMAIWGNKSAVSCCHEDLQLVPWDPSNKHTLPWDLVPMTASEAHRHLDGRGRYGVQFCHTVHVRKNIVQQMLQRASLRMSSWPLSDMEADLLLTACGFKSLVSESEGLLTVVGTQVNASSLCEVVVMTHDEAWAHAHCCPVYADKVLHRISEFQERVKELLSNETSTFTLTPPNDDQSMSEPFSDDVTVTSSGSEECDSGDDSASMDSFVVDDDASLVYDSDADDDEFLDD